MKQRITVDQLQELTEEQKQRLREWWKPKSYDVYYNARLECVECFNCAIPNNIRPEAKENILPLLDIGQMIELLMSKSEIVNNYDACNYFDMIPSIELGWEGMYDGIELCDALWQAVKEVL